MRNLFLAHVARGMALALMLSVCFIFATAQAATADHGKRHPAALPCDWTVLDLGLKWCMADACDDDNRCRAQAEMRQAVSENNWGKLMNGFQICTAHDLNTSERGTSCFIDDHEHAMTMARKYVARSSRHRK